MLVFYPHIGDTVQKISLLVFGTKNSIKNFIIPNFMSFLYVQGGMISRMFPQFAMVVASDAIEAVRMPPIALDAAPDAVRPVAVKFRVHQV